MSDHMQLADAIPPAAVTTDPREQRARLRVVRDIQRLIRQIDRLQAEYDELRRKGLIGKIDSLEAGHD